MSAFLANILGVNTTDIQAQAKVASDQLTFAFQALIVEAALANFLLLLILFQNKRKKS